jgi:Flp pilus assembly protein CpaB
MRKNKQVILTILITLALVCIAWSAGLGQVKMKTIRRVVVSKDVRAGSQLLPEHLATVEFPAGSSSECYFNEISQVAGQWTSIDLSPGELVNKRYLFNTASGILYPDAGTGRRLMTIKLEPAEANGFWLAAGNRVDLYFVPRSRESGLQVMVMANIRIMEVLGGDKNTSGAVNVTSDTLLCLDLDAGQVQTVYDSYGIYDIHLSVINESRLADLAQQD